MLTLTTNRMNIEDDLYTCIIILLVHVDVVPAVLISILSGVAYMA